jgi:hypothetical protein
MLKVIELTILNYISDTGTKQAARVCLRSFQASGGDRGNITKSKT